MDKGTAEQQLLLEIDRLRQHAAQTTDPCPVVIVIATSDPDVRERLLRHTADGDVFRGAVCVANDRVLFKFDGPPDSIALAPRSLLVLVNLASRRVVDVVDPYDPGPVTAVGQAASAAVVTGSSSEAPSALFALPIAASPHTAAHGGSLTPLLAPASTSTVTVTITNVTDRAIRVNDVLKPFPPFGDTATFALAAGTYRLDWFVQSDPGTTFTFTLTGATIPIAFSGTVSNAQRDNGFFSFSVA